MLVRAHKVRLLSLDAELTFLNTGRPLCRCPVRSTLLRLTLVMFVYSLCASSLVSGALMTHTSFSIVCVHTSQVPGMLL